MTVRRTPLSLQSMVGFGITLAGLIFTAGAGWFRLAQAEAHFIALSERVTIHQATPAHREVGTQVSAVDVRLRAIEFKVDVYGRNQAAICQAVGAQCR